MNTISPTAAQARELPNGNAGIARRATEAKLVDPRFSLYKSTEGYRAIMQWYDDVLEKLDVEVESRYVRTRFGVTHMLTAGPKDAEPLILVPGIAGCAPIWRRQLGPFAKHFRVYALDIVGQPGRSDPIPLSLLDDQCVHWLCDVLDGLDIDKAHFAGTSAGGWMVLRMGISAPDRVLKAVMLSPTGVSRARLPMKIWLGRALNKRKDADALEKDLTAKNVAAKTHGGSFGTFDRQLARLMALCTRHYRVDRSIGVYNEKTGRIDFVKGLRVLGKFFLSEPKKVLRKFNVPALLVFGEHEVLYSPNKVCRRMHRLIPGMTHAVIKGAGHAAIYDKPEEANARIFEFLTAS
ncbi:MAG: alpha/beta hydrolase [Gammaproteobacteria bacterium]|nr:alpha/beta hydrolase [Gammaproteobacteria bacterium]